jgi:hypothetical protein
MMEADFIMLLPTILVEKNINAAFFHIHILPDSAWSHDRHVEKQAYPTRKRTQKNIATTNCSRPQTQKCGNSKTATPT